MLSLMNWEGGMFFSENIQRIHWFSWEKFIKTVVFRVWVRISWILRHALNSVSPDQIQPCLDDGPPQCLRPPCKEVHLVCSITPRTLRDT